MTDNMIKKVFGLRLKNARQYRAMSREQLATLANTNKSHIWRLENGQTNPRLDTILKICEVLQIPTSELIPNPKQISNENSDFIEYFNSQSSEVQDKIKKIARML